MIIILSPAKSLDFETKVDSTLVSEISFPKEAEQLMKKLKKLSSKKIGDLMKVSPAIADLNYERNQKWAFPFNSEEVKQAAFCFTGEAYRGMDVNSFSDKEIENLQSRLRILSGLYGLLKPMDLIMPYRLEMGTRLPVGKKTNLYQFWDTKIQKALQVELDKQENKVLVNLASAEYFKAAKLKDLNAEIVTPIFKDNKNGTYKTIMTFAKKARGMMTAYIVKNNIQSVEGLKGFDTDGYIFNNEMSVNGEMVFTRG